ncbi:hypothetical protein CAPTEDRAFT_89073 [Capitella teleta]|uniref:Small-subunit processome Utp12 domain-containing protein n=1 Tax=Capitella teleta TaxID=283909 RepID=X2BAP9_CAPTE|nr:hypothetical protein CAPTEDRAFT_89073 [Capitella teleta]|eukprot:ELT90132.1 hypothetical protein CAPTEDRAFT_89073 [Capitella teleta]
MGLTKQYRRYEAAGLFGVVGGSWAGVKQVSYRGIHGKYVAVGACEHTFIWDLRTGEKVLTLEGEKHQVSCLSASPDCKHLAVGYSDGSIRIFNLSTGELAITFSGHKSAVTTMNYDHQGMRLVSGAMDTEVIVWDIVNEAGLYRLRGHKGVVTQAKFLKTCDVLITSSKDTYIKFWDLETQHCFKTLVGHNTEVWDFIVCRDESLLITGSTEMAISLWKLSYDTVRNEDEPVAKKMKTDEGDGEDGEDDDGSVSFIVYLLTLIQFDLQNILQCERLGAVPRHGKGRLVSMETDSAGTLLGLHGNDTSIEFYKILNDDELKKLRKKMEKKAKRKAREASEDESRVDVAVAPENILRRLTSVRMAGKVRSFQCLLEDNTTARVVSLLTNNVLQSCTIDLSEKNCEPTAVSKLNQPGHRTDVRTVCFSSDNTAILSASSDSARVWNRDTLQCIRSLTCEYALCSLFTPGDRHIVIGTKSGKLQIFDIASGTLLEAIDAHSGSVWSVCLSPDKRSIVSGSADKEVKFWDFELITDADFSTTCKRLTLVHTRTLQMSEDVLSVKFGCDGKFLAVALLDNTVKVFFVDTLKFFLSLYGHKLPVLCMDICTDGSLIATGSADRNVKIWGMDFGDCHRSLFAHDDSVMCLQFVPKTHMFFTGGKDGKIKQWDADTFQQIQMLEGHHAEVWSLAISTSGNFVVSAAHDKSLRLWEKTMEPLVLDEEKEMEREKEMEENVGEQAVVAGETNKETDIAGKKTPETVKATERLMEALEVYEEEMTKLRIYEEDCLAAKKELKKPGLHPLLQAFGVTTPSMYVLEVIKRIRSSELESSLLVMPFSYVTRLLPLLEEFVRLKNATELTCRCLLFLLKIHQGQVTCSSDLLPVIDALRKSTTKTVSKTKDGIGFNLSGLRFLQQMLEEKDEVMMFVDATNRMAQKKKKTKKRAILSIRT